MDKEVMQNGALKTITEGLPKNATAAIIEENVGWLEVHHNGKITWDELQEIKNMVWGEDAVAIEVYPPEKYRLRVGDNMARHLWRLGECDFWPNLKMLDMDNDSLQIRFVKYVR